MARRGGVFDWVSREATHTGPPDFEATVLRDVETIDGREREEV